MSRLQSRRRPLSRLTNDLSSEFMELRWLNADGATIAGLHSKHYEGRFRPGFLQMCSVGKDLSAAANFFKI